MVTDCYDCWRLLHLDLTTNCVSTNHLCISSNFIYDFPFIQASISCKADSTVYISSKKAKELKVKSGQVVGVIGRRRRASYAIVETKKISSTSSEISRNLGSNLRIRDGDKIKIIKLSSADTDEEASGDMSLMAAQPSTAESATLSPIEDSYNELVATEGGDEIPDEEIMERFVAPYLDLEDGESKVLLKKGHVLTLRDENGRSLDFLVTNIEVDGAAEEEEADEGKRRYACVMLDILVYAIAIGIEY